MFSREVSKLIIAGALLSVSSLSYAASTGSTTNMTGSLGINNWMILVPNADDEFTPNLGFDVDQVSKIETTDRNGEVLTNGDERFTGQTTFAGRLMGSTGDANPVASFSWDMEINADPFIDANFTITNLTGMDQTFNLSFGIPVTPTFNDGIETGFLGFTLNDANGSGDATVQFTNWDGTINGAVEMEIFAASPFSCFGANCFGSVAPVSGGPENYVGPVNTIGIDMTFILSAGDSITIDTRYEVAPIPVPAAVWLFGSSLLGLFGISKRQ